ncbi:MAG: helix-turn-helix transcriptional regulator [Bacteroidota bacterium]
MSIGKRLKALVDSQNISVQKFAIMLGQSEASVYNYLSDKTVPKLDTASVILSSFPDVNPYWLLLGKGEMMVKEGEYANIGKEEESSIPSSLQKQYEDKILDLERIIESNERTIKNQEDMIEILKRG